MKNGCLKSVAVAGNDAILFSAGNPLRRRASTPQTAIQVSKTILVSKSGQSYD